MARRHIAPERLRRIKRIFAPVRAAILCAPMAWLAGLSTSQDHTWLWSALLLLFVDIVLERLTIPAQASGWKQDKGSKGTLGISFLLILGLGFFERGRGLYWPLPTTWELLLRWSGLALLLGGVAFRQWAIHSLGRHFTDRARILQAHQLIELGPYRWIRHPSYTGLVLIFFGFAAYLASPLALLLCAVLLPLSLWRRINVEEALMHDHFGVAWERFAKKRGRLMPHFW